ncbi:MAG: S-adenosyl-L-methionine-dependent methyltransferase [Monoraphidium minutum]|nr:MAG: S-adenosyl-L-methionine-dependent methyltransferase [Monoraphidium minutum]
MHQLAYCSARVPVPVRPIKTRFAGTNVTVYVYEKDDLVSNYVQVEGTWEERDVREMAYAMAAPVPAAPDDLRRPERWAAAAAPFVVDVGANVGTFTLHAAARGATVAAFEPMASNIALLRTSLCANPPLLDRVALYGTGLGTKRADCIMLSDVANRGNGFTECERTPEQAQAYLRQRYNITFQVRGEMSVMRLDDLIDRDVQVIKLDVEGYEREVLGGAERLLRERRVWFLMTGSWTREASTSAQTRSGARSMAWSK